jgi:hypothetical protein
MKAIVVNAIINSFSTRVDKSLGFRGVTPELTDAEAVALMGMRGINLRLLLEPCDYATDGKLEVKGVLDQKPASQRLRAVLYVQFRQLTAANKIETQTFVAYYANVMNRLIEDIKSTLDPE